MLFDGKDTFQSVIDKEIIKSNNVIETKIWTVITIDEYSFIRLSDLAILNNSDNQTSIDKNKMELNLLNINLIGFCSEQILTGKISDQKKPDENKIEEEKTLSNYINHELIQ